jgi:hypothetical protein
MCVAAWLAKEAWAAAEYSRALPPVSGQPDAAPASSGLNRAHLAPFRDSLYTEADKGEPSERPSLVASGHASRSCFGGGVRRNFRTASIHHLHRCRAADTGRMPAPRTPSATRTRHPSFCLLASFVCIGRVRLQDRRLTSHSLTLFPRIAVVETGP